MIHEDKMDCPVCFTWDHEPKRLSCKHHLCVKCAESMLDKANHVIKCPSCNQEEIVENGDVANLPTHLLKQKLHDLVSKHLPKKQEYSRCTLCKASTNIIDMKMCHNCNMDMCNTCAVRHGDNPTFANHKMECRTNVFCITHELACNFYCVRCEKFMCVACINNANRCGDHHQDRKQLIDLKEKKMQEIAMLKEKVNANYKAFESDGKMFLEKIQTNLQECKESKQALKLHVDNLIKQIKDREQDLMTRIVEREEVLNLMCIGVKAELGDSCIGRDLQDYADEGIKGGIEEVITTASLLRSLVAPTFNTNLDSLDKHMNFKAQSSLQVEDITVNLLSASDAKAPLSVNKKNKKKNKKGSGDLVDKFPKIDWTKPPKLIWTEKITDGRDVTFLPSGNLLITQCGDNWLDAKNVKMYSSNGELITTSKDQGVELDGAPWTVIYDTFEGVVIVADFKDRLTFLDPLDLHLKKRVVLQGDGGALGLSVLSDGGFVVRTEFSNIICIYDRQGRLMRHIGVAFPVETNYLNFVCVIPEDIIVAVSTRSKTVAYLSIEGDSLQEVEMNSPIGMGLDSNGEVLVVSCHEVKRLSGRVGNKKEQTVIRFSENLYREIGEPLSVAQQGKQLAVVWRHEVRVYELHE